MSVAFSQVAPVLSSALVRSVLDSTPDAMIIIDATGTIVFANRQVGVLFGYSSAEIVGQPVETLMPARFRQGHTLHRMNYASAPRVRPMGSGLELYAQRQDGSEFPVEISLSPIWQEGQTNPAVAGKRILLVEDDVTVRAATRLLLKVEGYHVTPAASLAETREILRTMRDFDAIVTDYHLGDTETGLQVIETAREALGPAAKAVLVTGDTSATIRTLQHDDHVRVASKPINADELLRLLQTLLAS